MSVHKSFYQQCQRSIQKQPHDQEQFLLASLQFIKKRKINNYYLFQEQMLGKGTFASVYKGINILTNEFVAIKMLDLKYLTENKLYILLNSQIQVLKTLKNPHVLKFYDVIYTLKNCYIITQLCSDGQLNVYLDKMSLNEQDYSQLQKLLYDIYLGLLYLQRKHIIHRDIKMNNILVKNGIAKIADFGFAKYINNQIADYVVGSPIYMAPQVIFQKLYSPKTDVWAFGILIYQFFHGFSLYQNCKDQCQLQKKIKIPFNRNMIKAFMPQQAIDLIIKCLQFNKQKRPSFKQLWRQKYITQLRFKYNNILNKNQIKLQKQKHILEYKIQDINNNQNKFTNQITYNKKIQYIFQNQGYQFQDFVKISMVQSGFCLKNQVIVKQKLQKQMEQFYTIAQKMMNLN